MKEHFKSWPGFIAGFQEAAPGSAAPDTEADLPFRAELYSAQQMAHHGRTLAETHVLSKRRGPDQLLSRLADNARVLRGTAEELTSAVKEGRQITPASEWLLDNYYLIEEHIRIARRHLPKDYSKELPRLEKGAVDGTPRVYRLALEVIAHGDGRVDPESLCRFVEAYQELAPLTLGELWAIPIMLRLALLENLRRVAARVAENRYQRDLANSWADGMVEIADKNPSGLILLVADMARSNPPITSGFVAELARRLQGQSPALTLALTWVTYRLAEAGQTIEQQIQAEIGQQAADQVSIANTIGSLRFLGTMDWQEFVETMSTVERALREDPSGIYGAMDFATRDHYRHVVEKVARGCRLTEAQVAQEAVELARAHAGSDDPRHGHVGFYLVDKGVLLLEKKVARRRSPRESLRATVRAAPLASYLGAIAALSVIATALMVERAMRDGVAGWETVVLAVLGLMGSSQLALALVNWVATLVTHPSPLPRMDFKAGIPSDARAIVVVPSLFYSLENVDELCEQLEVRFLANRDPNLHFCLLSDFADAPAETLPTDAGLLERARAHIEDLNRKYGQEDNACPFVLLHRPRLWNPAEGAWMGQERKRGKLADLNRFLRGGARDRFTLVVGDSGQLPTVKYVITLDADTQLARDSARQFIATMRHPLNQPVVKEMGRGAGGQRCNRVVSGYGILQPRVAVSLPSPDASLYERLCGGEPGIDPYTRTVSDVYQDVFAEGSFIGKGIYDVDVFEQVLGERFPDNRILSHDLLEGCYLRAGLLSDAQLYEQYPQRYLDDVSRRHRWIRGDWQLAGWLAGRVPTASGTRGKNPLSALSRWKLFDNLRRSLVAPALTLSLLFAFAVLPHPWFYTSMVLAIIFVPAIAAALYDLSHKSPDTLWRQHLPNSLRRSGLQFAHGGLSLVFLPYEAYISLDAIARTAWRLLVSKRHLLQWRPSALSRANGGLVASWRAMWMSPVLALAVGTALALWRMKAFEAAAIFLVAWLVAPVVAWWISRPVERLQAQLGNGQRQFLHTVARKTWAWFDTFVGPDDNWLPPDNVQEHPGMVIAHRTSPTNIGMALLANVSAYDFGYLTLAQLLQRTRNTLDTMGELERYQGHFYNWYDTQSKKPLHPVYVSTVDSGNLAGHLLVLQAALLNAADEPVVGPRVVTGLETTLAVLQEALAGAEGTATADPGAITALREALVPQQHPSSLPELRAYLERASAAADAFAAQPALADNATARTWAGALAAQCRAAFDDLVLLAPWIGAGTGPEAAGAGVVDTVLLKIPTLRELASYPPAGAPLSELAPGERERREQLGVLVEQGAAVARERMAHLRELAGQACSFAQLDYGFLYNRTTRLLAIGYNVTERRLDASYYDLLASEVRLASYVAVAQGQLPQEHWFALGRQLAIVHGQPVLMSWSGSMFEYLMPLLVMPTYPSTLLDQTYRSVVAAQIEYARQRNVPWGISESGYTTVDAAMNYQYRAFGVPGLGMKRGLADDLVIAPYASMMALMVDPEAACQNLEKMAGLGFIGRYGFYEAIDYTPARLPRGQPFAVVKSFMVHHQGMGFLALSYLLHDRPMQRRFESDPMLQSALLMLQERSPRIGAFFSTSSEQAAAVRSTSHDQAAPVRVLAQPNTPVPEVQLLSNGRYHVMVTAAGGSSSRWHDLAVTRWREDTTRDNWGQFCYVRDEDGHFWSNTYQPTLAEPEHYEVIFSEGRAEYRRTDRGIDLHTDIVVSPEDDIEMRRLRVTNNSNRPRTLELTSFAEVVMAPAAADMAHPAFSKLFVQTEILGDESAILCTRRPRGKGEQSPCMLHVMTVHDAEVLEVSFETDRAHFIGRGNSARAPRALVEPGPLAGGHGSVLDPAVAIRYRITLPPDSTATIDIATGMTETREAARHLIDKYQDRHMADRVFELAWTHSQVVLRQLNASEADGQLYSRLANHVIYPNAALRADPSVLIKNHRGQSNLWPYAISGDLPIVLLQVKDSANIEVARQMVQAHAYWRLKGLTVDLVIWFEDTSGYRQALYDQIIGMIASGIDAQAIDRPGGIFVRPLEQISSEDRILLQTVARMIVNDARGPLAEQVKRSAPPVLRVPPLLADSRGEYDDAGPATHVPHDLILWNGFGGFTPDGREYVIVTGHGRVTPAPWSNVLANAQFGSVISESGQAYTWHENAHEFRLTPWHNDPVTDAGGEAFYLRDEASGHFWSPTPLPARGSGDYVTRHGFGYSTFEHTEAGIGSVMTTYVSNDAPVRYTVLKVRNGSPVARKLSVTGYVEWVLGEMRSKSAMHVVTELDAVSGALFARNPYNMEFSGRVAFFSVDAATRTVTSDRTEFLGRNGTLASPAALRRQRLSGKVGTGLDACAALQVPFELLPGEERELVFVLGMGGRRNADASTMAQKHGGAAAARDALAAVHAHWQATLGAVRIATPEPALDVIANGWLMYQTIACRLWARSGYYQSGGAFGYRDQLQDAMAMVHTEPQLLREHLVLCAAHQFAEGDVQHWWHPPSDRGVRTHCSDDYLWLPLATARYVKVTGDLSVLDEEAQYLEGRPVKADEDSYYDMPGRSPLAENLYQHCVRAIRHGLRFGERGLPLIGSCDWNDGMDKVGAEGKGESVWLAWFLVDVLRQFAEVAERRGDGGFAAECRSEAVRLAENVEKNAWDGQWYRRAYFDDGTPLGSHESEECQIDSISQSWGVLSGAADPERARGAMAQVDARLVRRDAGFIQLLDPPFDKADPNPGYIQGYVPGVRENGGQYTHAAVWTVMAFAALGDTAKAWELMRLINPVQHASSAENVAIYKVEPYVVTADIYAVEPHVGRGGWSWYTGSSGWMYRLILESLLGVTRNGDRLSLAPKMPDEWDGFELSYRYGSSTYAIRISRGAPGLTVDGVAVAGNEIALADDRREHAVELRVP
ncbi:GH36-type glycosyl hydrolase domain-containing protein [Pseudoduganella albidiflava]|uniref:Cyclic beta 1-2 glucan synthetase n=2 Tax=Pseudoduganella albidiflava TaxID=321983 RepID=A0AA87XNX5_9BURK|nr:cyclic beta 1-2 glucan synthetase [Pseudoduganella albidiflava]